MEWKGQSEWQASPETEWQVNGQHAGSVKAAGPLSFVKVSGAGHMVSTSQYLISTECVIVTLF